MAEICCERFVTMGSYVFFEVPLIISHKRTIKKAKGEYRKYQVMTLLSVEEEYLQSIKSTVKDVKRKAEIK